MSVVGVDDVPQPVGPDSSALGGSGNQSNMITELPSKQRFKFTPVRS